MAPFIKTTQRTTDKKNSRPFFAFYRIPSVGIKY